MELRAIGVERGGGSDFTAALSDMFHDQNYDAEPK
jgi:hypothetical protein